MASDAYDLYLELVEKMDLRRLRRPALLYHYTTIAGLLGIIGTKTLFLSDALFLNDQSELTYGRDLIGTCLRDYRSSCPQSLKSVFAEVLDHFGPQSSGSPLPFKVYVASFCKRSNLLSQWRAYAQPGSGVAIGFASRAVLAAAGMAKTTGAMELRPVIYDRSKQERLIRKMLQRAVDIVAHFRGTRSLERTECALAIELALAGFVPELKHPVFAEEQEWRLLYSVLEPDATDLRFRQVSGGMVPYLAIGLEATVGEFRGRLPIREITHAPGPEPELRKRALRELLSAHKYPDHTVIVSGSNIPLRLS